MIVRTFFLEVAAVYAETFAELFRLAGFRDTRGALLGAAHKWRQAAGVGHRSRERYTGAPGMRPAVTSSVLGHSRAESMALREEAANRALWEADAVYAASLGIWPEPRKKLPVRGASRTTLRQAVRHVTAGKRLRPEGALAHHARTSELLERLETLARLAALAPGGLSGVAFAAEAVGIMRRTGVSADEAGAALRRALTQGGPVMIEGVDVYSRMAAPDTGEPVATLRTFGASRVVEIRAGAIHAEPLEVGMVRAGRLRKNS